MNTRKNLLSAAMAAALGAGAMVVPTTAAADIVALDWNGLFTMQADNGDVITNTSQPYVDDPTWLYGRRTPISGTMTFDTHTGSGSGTVNAFDFFGADELAVTDMTLQAFGDADTADGDFQDGTLVLANMLFSWSGTSGIPLSLVLDAAGLFAQIGPGPDTDLVVGQVIDQENAGVVIPATDNAEAFASIPIGDVPIATTSWDTTPTCNASSGPDNTANCLGVSPIGGFPLLAGASGTDINGTPNAAPISGSPMMDGPFAGANASFDITSMTVTQIDPVPVPAAVWLFGSGLMGLAGVAKRRKP